MSARQQNNNLWNLIIILSLLPLIKSHSGESGLKFNKSCDNNEYIGSNLVINNSINPSDEYDFQFDYSEFNLNFTSDEISKECKNSIKILEHRAKLFDLNALRILDASAKIGSGILRGSTNNFGDFDECLESKVENFQGKYCLAEIQFEIQTHLKHFKSLILANEPYKNELNDVTHILPRTSTIFWGVCMPSICNYKELEIALRNTIEQKFGKYLISIHMKVKERNCQVQEEFSWISISNESKLTIAFFLLLLIISCVATIYDLNSLQSQKNETLMAFSMKKNFNEIMSTDISPREIPSLHGIRIINSLMLIMGHKTMGVYFQPIINKVETSELYNSFVSVPLRALFLFTEVFLMLSGLLSTHSIVGKLNKGQKINVVKEIAARYFRIIPPIIALMLISTFILPILGNGPLWPDSVTATADICKKNGWMNLFMIQNWFGFENICNFNLHHVGTDFVIFIASLPLLVYLHKFPKHNITIILILGALSTVARFYVTYMTDLVIYVRFASTQKQMLETANFMYGIPPYRFTSYSIGILMGYILRNQQPQKLGSKFVNIGWIAATAGMVVVMVLASLVHYAYSPLNMAIFSAVTPNLFCAFFAWIIYVSHHQSGNKFTRFFEWKYFKVTSALSYGIYLYQFQIFNYLLGSLRGPIYFTAYNQMFHLNELLLIVVGAFLLTLLIELPFGNIKKILFDKKLPEKINSTKSDKDE
ncbi:O-acyltransferase like protein-like [Chironomus tepperi]|uniref:O-acyltransferase like protein-like n=1 Tax=Chironomus tepperi TaxID=113505 RepID=UPI00391F7665